jgi:hypothetical protein
VANPAPNGIVSGAPAPRTRSVMYLSLCDSLPAYGPIADMTFSLAKLGVRAYQCFSYLHIHVLAFAHVSDAYTTLSTHILICSGHIFGTHIRLHRKDTFPN